MDFHKRPRSTILHLYLGSLFAPDGRTNGRRANFLERYDFDNHPFGVDNEWISAVLGDAQESSLPISDSPS